MLNQSVSLLKVEHVSGKSQSLSWRLEFNWQYLQLGIKYKCSQIQSAEHWIHDDGSLQYILMKCQYGCICVYIFLKAPQALVSVKHICPMQQQLE